METPSVANDLMERLIADPIGTYNDLHGRFLGMPQLNKEMPELFFEVKKLLDELNSEWVMALAQGNPAIGVMRRLVMQSLRHVAIVSRGPLPFQETIRAIQAAVEFLDVCVRTSEAIASGQDAALLVSGEENPRERALDYYHRYRYLYYWHGLLHAMPYVFPIPTSRSFTAMEMMRFRCVPIFIIGIVTAKTYVDEFWQTPAEFWFHDANHARRQYAANEAWFKKNGIYTHEERVALYQRSHRFSKELLDAIELGPVDSEEEKAQRQLMLIILFEITHENAEPFLPDAIAEAVQRMEGFPSMFEVPSIDPETGLMNVMDTQEIGIATLSYVRAKLQGAFYDEIGQADSSIVPEEYRTVEWISKAAYRLLEMINATALEGVPQDEAGLPTLDYLLDRACSVGPEIVHKSQIIDPIYEERAGRLREVNIKNYFTSDSGVGSRTEEAISGLMPQVGFAVPLAEIRIAADVVVLSTGDGIPQVLLRQNDHEPCKGMWSLPGVFVWQDETTRQAAHRAVISKVGVACAENELEQKAFFDDPSRDPRTRVASTVYLLDLGEEIIEPSNGYLWVSVHELPRLAFDHAAILATVLH